MSTGTTIIQDALRKIGAHSNVAPADAEALALGLNALNSMMEMWLTQGIVLAVAPLNKIGDDLEEALDVRNGIVCNLAILMAPDFDNGKAVVSQELRSLARSGFATIEGLYKVVTVPGKVVSSTLPRGAGNRNRTGSRNRTFFNEGETLDN